MNLFTFISFKLLKYTVHLFNRSMFYRLLFGANIFRKPIFVHVLNEHILKRLNLSRLAVCILVSFFGLPLAQAQDIHFSQFYNSPLTTNPALTGIFRGDVRIYGLLRSQWDAANSPYRTIHLAADGKLFNPRMKKGFFSVGGQLYRDEAGDSNLRLTTFGISGAYTLALDAENYLTFGTLVSIGQRKFDFGNLTWDNQFAGDAHNSNLSSNESFDNDSRMFADFSVGVNWHGQKKDKRSSMDVGVGVFHLTSPKQNFDNGDEARLPVRISLYMMPTIQISTNGDIVLSANAQLQDQYTELLGGGFYRYYVNTKKTKEVALEFGGALRFNAISDAFVIHTGLNYRYLNVAFTYDINISDFKEATNRFGGPELSARYTFHKVRPLQYRKVCPLL